MTAWYFGCRHEAGHFLVNPDESWSIDPPPGFPWERQLDGGLTPGERDHAGHLLHQGRQSRAAIRRKDGWTVLAVHDFTLDSRGGSNAAFIFDEDLPTATLMVRVARDFPADVARIAGSEGLLIVEDDPA